MIVRLIGAMSLLALAACGDQQTATTAPATTGPGTTTSNTTKSTTTAPATTPSTTATPGTTGTTTGTTPPVGSGGGIPVPSLANYQGQQFSSGQVSMMLKADNTFELKSNTGTETVQGSYTFTDGTLTFTNAKGDIGGATFPMRCRLAPTSNGFQLLEASGGNCNYFRDLNFRKAA